MNQNVLNLVIFTLQYLIQKLCERGLKEGEICSLSNEWVSALCSTKDFKLIQFSIYERIKTTDVHFATSSISELHPGSSLIYKPMFRVAR
jgi:hypothetical protein